jgi:hypothetical protein
MEGFDVAVLPGATGLDEECFHLDLSSTLPDFDRGELRTVIAS